MLESANESWCPDGFEQGPSDTCFAIPEHPAADAPVLVYLHGMYVGHGSKDEWDAVRVATQRGFAVVVPRGKRGLCAWRAELKDHFCWPQDPEDTEAMKGVIAEWGRVLWQVDALLEGATHKRYVLGAANGALFAAIVATHGLFPSQGYAVVNGGDAAAIQGGKGKPVPVLLVSAADDADQAPRTKELHEGLAKVGWAHAFCPRNGSKTMTVEDVEAALRFFRHEADGSLKAQGGLYPCDGAAPAATRPKSGSHG